MQSGMRVLVASPLGHMVEPTLAERIPKSAITVAVDRFSVQQAVTSTYRFDVVIVDLVWNHPELEFCFDGLDVVDMLVRAERLAPVLLATQGHSMERDLVDEARLRPEVAGVFAKSSGVPALLDVISAVAIGRRLPDATPPDGPPPLYELFDSQRGATAARLAGAIAAGRATDALSLARAAQVGTNTANKVTSTYIGPIIKQRNEHDPTLPLTLGSVYRWCGLHARYLVSWCRRNGHSDVLRPEHFS
ncbi:hypothetical protein [Nocardia africana]|nr:hypothetical protein [Nocardia africana]MCC3313686.1 response regulator [Nocardia africana]